MMNPFRRRTDRAFTLVELLVVVSIIALLMSILLPSLSRARETARQVACSSNMRQIGMADIMYADHHNDWYTPIRMTGVDLYEGYVWAWNPGFRSLMSVAPLQSNSELTHDEVPVNLKCCYGSYPSGMTCPSAPQWQREVGDVIHSYGMNFSIGAEWDPNFDPDERQYFEQDDGSLAMKRNAVDNKSNKIKTVDANEWWINLIHANYEAKWDVTGPPSRWWGGQKAVTYRHREGANFLYFDGHVDYLQKEKAYPQDTQERRAVWMIDAVPDEYR
jgi:prepilin-type N-terminal cleavage/methylation domain-containing protein/prepilin-type processing-associated H-X9-DG protein